MILAYSENINCFFWFWMFCKKGKNEYLSKEEGKDDCYVFGLWKCV